MFQYFFFNGATLSNYFKNESELSLKTSIEQISQVGLIDKVYDSYTFEIKTSLLNEIIQEAQMMNETPDFNGGRCKVYYTQQVGSKPMTIALFCNEPSWMHFSYLRYLENRIRESFELVGSPINLVCRRKK